MRLMLSKLKLEKSKKAEIEQENRPRIGYKQAELK